MSEPSPKSALFRLKPRSQLARSGRGDHGPGSSPAITRRALTSFDEGNVDQVDARARKELRAAVSMAKLGELPILKGRPGLYDSESE